MYVDKLFDVKFVRCVWNHLSSEMSGVFIADDLSSLREAVLQEDNGGLIVSVIDSGDIDFPFRVAGVDCYRYCYYDPQYKIKKAYLDGKCVEVLENGMWVPVNGGTASLFVDVPWPYDGKPVEDFRISSSLATKIELMRWLAKGNGLMKHDSVGLVNIVYREYEGELDAQVSNGILVRKWDDKEWHRPTRRYLGLEESKCLNETLLQ